MSADQSALACIEPRLLTGRFPPTRSSKNIAAAPAAPPTTFVTSLSAEADAFRAPGLSVSIAYARRSWAISEGLLREALSRAQVPAVLTLALCECYRFAYALN